MILHPSAVCTTSYTVLPQPPPYLYSFRHILSFLHLRPFKLTPFCPYLPISAPFSPRLLFSVTFCPFIALFAGLCRTGKKGKAKSVPGPTLEWLQRVKIAVGAAKGIEYLHEKCNPPVLHKNIKSSNVLLFYDFDAKVADFSLSNQSPDQASKLHSTRVLGTFGYYAPE